MKKKSKIGKFKTVFNGALFEVRQAEIMLPSGRKGKFEVVSRAPSVSILALDDRKRLLLNREYRPKYKKRVWRLPGGSVEKGESEREAAQRELQEETGFKAGSLKLFHKAATGQTLDWRRSIFLGQNLIHSKLPSDEGENIEIEFLTLQEAMRLVARGEIGHDLTEYLIYKLFWKMKS